uniref:Pyridine nucleotide-disulfide oxidoreductase n=1 Tax=OCS116 cluster bacterium TaxID=2030921 RepID=A0A2A4Z6U0_9PROT
MNSIIVVGAGQTAVSVVLKMRKNGYGGKITIIGDENKPPYQRPPLSKKYLTGEVPEEKLYLRTQQVYDDLDIEMRLGIKVVLIDRASKQLLLSDAEKLPYDKLVLATGARPRNLPDSIKGDFQNVYTFRTLDDARKLRSIMTTGQRILIIGGGYVGLEMAAVASTLNLEVTVVEMCDRILQRVASTLTADYFKSLHSNHDVDICEGVSLRKLEGSGNRADIAVMSDGSAVGVDIIIVGIGVVPNIELARNAGLPVDNGILVDEHCRTFDPNIFAAGDCASFPYNGVQIRLESVPNAIAQGEHVADIICDIATKPYVPLPWFWSDQYDVKLQIAGLNTGYTDAIIRKNDHSDLQSVWYFKNQSLLAVDAINDVKSFMQGKKWLKAGISPDPTKIAQSNISFSECLVPVIHHQSAVLEPNKD